MAVSLPGPLPKTKRGIQLLPVITNRFSKLIGSAPLQTTTATVFTKALLNHCLYTYGARLYVLTDSEIKLVAKFFAADCAMLGVRRNFTTAHHSQTKEQTERFNRTTV